MNPTESQLLEEFRRISATQQEDMDGWVSRRDLEIAWGIGPTSVYARLRKLMRAGALESKRGLAPRELDGMMNTTVLYKVKSS
jgi:hypothetical protein